MGRPDTSGATESGGVGKQSDDVSGAGKTCLLGQGDERTQRISGPAAGRGQRGEPPGGAAHEGNRRQHSP